ncbi:MAG TPA: ATP-binding protein, partial [Candidatus Aquicultoraceae bacterium]|nr:ATP-binding protein [Candidatus Aquicultoraceae bacterium]
RRLCDEREKLRDGSVELRFQPVGDESPGDEMRWVHCRALTIRYGGAVAALVNMVDVTAFKRMEEVWNAQARLVSLGQIAAGIAHQIRNPLSGVTIALSTFEKIRARAKDLDRRDREDLSKACQLARSSVERIENIVRQVSTLGKTSRSKASWTDVKRCVEGMIPFLTPELTRAGIEVRADVRGDLPGGRIEPTLLDQVLVNLIHNAAQALEGAAGRKMVEIHAAVENGFVVVSVSDSGPGVPPAMRERIFDPFFSTRHAGVGIGLSFSRKVIAEHGGFLDVRTSSLGGATFRIGIPVAAAPQDAGTDAGGLPEAPAEKRGPARPRRHPVL